MIPTNRRKDDIKEFIEKLLKRVVDRYEVIQLYRTDYNPDPEMPDWKSTMHVATLSVTRLGRHTGTIKVYNMVGANHSSSWKTEEGVHSWKVYGERLEDTITDYYYEQLETERREYFRKSVSTIRDK